MDMNEVFNGLTLFLVSILVLTQTTGISEPFETIIGVVVFFGIIIPPSYLLAGFVVDRISD